MTKAEDVIRKIAMVISPMTYLLNKKLTDLDKKEKKDKKDKKGRRTTKKAKK
jgi:hypothetical protein